MDNETVRAKRDALLRQMAEARQVLLRLEGAIAILNQLLEDDEDDESDPPTLLRTEETG